MNVITAEERERVYHLLAQEKCITTKGLHESGFSKRRINSLLRENVIKRVKVGEYELWSIGTIYLYAIDQVALGNIEEAVACYERYYEKNPTSPTANFAMFARCVIEGEYDDIENYLDGFMRPVEDSIQNNDYNFYLYLLSFVIELPERYKDRARRMSYADIKMQESKNDRSLSSLRAMVFFNQNFAYANKFIEKMEDKSTGDVVTRHLLKQALERQRNYVRRIGVLLRERSIRSLVELLEAEEKRHELRVTWKAFLSLSRDILWMRRTGVPIAPVEEETGEFFRLIQLKNYDMARANNRRFIACNRRFKVRNELGVLLDEAIAVRDAAYDRLKIKRMHRERHVPLAMAAPITQMLEALRAGDIEDGFAIARAIIDIKGLHEYDYLIIDLIKICIEENDQAFIKPLIVISELGRGVFQMDFGNCLSMCDYFISEKRLASARLCLDIIVNASRYGHVDVEKEELAEILKDLESKLHRGEREEKRFSNDPARQKSE